jgi:hypothetical protein
VRTCRAIASLYQDNLEVERDGDRLQELFRFYIGLGLPVYVGQIEAAGRDADFLVVGQELEGRTCASPVGTSAAGMADRAVARSGTGARRTCTCAMTACWPTSC